MNIIPRRIATVPSSPSLPLKSQITPQAFQLRARHVNAITLPRFASTATATSTQSESSPEQSAYQPQATKKKKPLTKAQKEYLHSALRVNQAGELAAILIYSSQSPPIAKAYPHLRPLMKHMYDQEAGHFRTFNALLAKHRIRPTAMYPLWHTLATGLGWATGVMGREAAMACTEAVETEIGEHYNEQVKELMSWKNEGVEGFEEDGSGELDGLLKEVRRIRDEELEHLDHAVEEDAKMAQPYEVLNGVIRAGCRGAIWVSERV